MNNLIDEFKLQVGQRNWNAERAREELTKVEKAIDSNLLNNNQSKQEKTKEASDKRREGRGVNQKRKLWFSLLEWSVNTGQLELALLLVARLELRPLKRLLRQILVELGPEVASARLVALAHLSQYVGLAQNDYLAEIEAQTNDKLEDKRQTTTRNQTNNKTDFRGLRFALECLVDASDWVRCERLQAGWPIERESRLAGALVAWERAKQLELEEQFSAALSEHEAAGSADKNNTRVAMKRLALEGVASSSEQPNNNKWAARRQLESDCGPAAAHELARIVGDGANKEGVPDLGTDPLTPIAAASRQRALFELQQVGRDPEASLRRTVADLAGSERALFMDWSQATSVSQSAAARLRDLGHTLSAEKRAEFARLVGLNQTELVHSVPIWLCLGQESALIAAMSQQRQTQSRATDSAQHLNLINFVDRLEAIERMASLSGDRTTRALLDLLQEVRWPLSLSRYPLEGRVSAALARLLLGAGLLGERMRLFARQLELGAEPSSEAAQLNDSCVLLLNDERSQGRRCERLDPQLPTQPIESLCSHFSRSANALASRACYSAAVCYLICVLVVCFQKRPPAEPREASDQNVDTESELSDLTSDWLLKLESLSGQLSRLLALSSPATNTTDTPPLVHLKCDGDENLLLRSSGRLLDLTKVNMDSISSSDSLRHCVRLLVESLAGRCLMESLYREAASLYGQIGDQLGALKALMRTNDAQLVAQFGLLNSGELAVQRVALNYLRHMKAPAELIEDFELRVRRQLT